MDKTVAMVELEARLLKDADGQVRDEILARLRHYQTAVKEQLDKGAAPELYSRWESLRLALDAAAATVESVWRRKHQKTQS